MKQLQRQTEGHTCGYVALHNWMVLRGTSVPSDLRQRTGVDKLRGVLPGRLLKLMRNITPADYYRGPLNALPTVCFPAIVMIDAGYRDPHWVVAVKNGRQIEFVDGLNLQDRDRLPDSQVLLTLASRVSPRGVTGLPALLCSLPGVAKVFRRYL